MKRRGFTLIELLIVVAIIAILAAIAVPNFLEAQVRSKVARVHADMRSMATAIEAYTVDHNRAPVSGREWSYGIFPEPDPRCWRLGNWERQLTTPIAYISEAPADPFLAMAPTLGGLSGQDNWGVREPGSTFVYAHYNCYAKLVQAGNTSLANVFDGLVNHSMTWAIESAGPSRVVSDPDQPDSTFMTGYYITGAACGIYTPTDDWWVGGTYDPTNGTMSRGYIMRTNQGILASPKSTD